MPEQVKVYCSDGTEHIMYSVDAREAIQRHPDEWAYKPFAAKKGRKAAAEGATAGPEVVDGYAPGQVDRPPLAPDADGFGPEKGGSPQGIPVFSGATRLQVDPKDPAPPQINERQATKAESIAASREPEEAGAAAPSTATGTRRSVSGRSRRS
jgi:hypothetical protein